MSDTPGHAIDELARAARRRRWQSPDLALYVGVIAALVGKVAGGNPLGFFVAGLAMAGFALGLLNWLRGADVGRTTALYEQRERLAIYGKAWLALAFEQLDDHFGRGSLAVCAADEHDARPRHRQ